MGDRGVGRNDRILTVSTFIRLHKGYEKRGHRIGVALKNFNSLVVYTTIFSCKSNDTLEMKNKI